MTSSHRSTSPTCPFAAPAAPSQPPSPYPAGVWPPGPRGLTGWGHLARMRRDLLGQLAAWQSAYGDVVHLRIWPEHQVVVMEPTLARDLLVTHNDALVRWERGIAVFSQLHGQSVFVSEGAAWRAKRQALHAAFTRQAVQTWVPAMTQATEHALNAWASGVIPIESAFTALAMEVIVRMLFSTTLSQAEVHALEQAVHTALVEGDAEFYVPISAPDWAPWKRAKRHAFAVLQNFVAAQVQTRLRQPEPQWPNDLLTRLLQLHRSDPVAWPLQAVHDECITAFGAGHETTAATLTWWAWCMASYPEAQRVAREEVQSALQGRAPAAHDLPVLRYLGQTLQETLRLYPAAPVLLSRRSTRPISLGAWQFPARTLFMVPLVRLHHDARWFADPLRFVPERFAPGTPTPPRGAFMPFGAGPRVCLDQHLAMTELTVVAALVLQRYALSVPEGLAEPAARLHVSLRPAHALHLCVSPVR